MFSPFDLYLKKKFPNEESESKDVAKKEWESLDSKKKLKYIKKVERKYDSEATENPDLPPLHTYLTIKELEILIKSYGLPERLPANSKLYFIKNFQEESTKTKEEGEENKLDEKSISALAINKWNNLSANEKADIFDDLHKKLEEYNDQFFEFARKLPENRVKDYKEFQLKRKKLEKSEKKHENLEKSKNHATTPTAKRRNPLRELNKKFHPFEIYLEKHKEEFENKDIFKMRNEARVKYGTLSEKKKFKYIKKAEENYDDYYKNGSIPHQPLGSYLNKKEMEILLKSYGMPERVPNFTAYYMKLKSKEGMRNMKEIFDNLKQMSADDRKKLEDQHNKDFEEYSIKKKEFLDNLPASRLEDYNKNQKPKSKKSQKTVNSSPRKKLKKSDNSDSEINGLKDSDEESMKSE